VKIPIKQVVVIFIVVISLFITPVSAGSPVWLGGYQVGVEGYGQGGPFFAGEYLQAGLFIDPFDWNVMNPLASVAFLVPVFPQTIEPTWIELQVGLELFSIKNHPVDAILTRESDLVPSLHAGILFNPQDFSQSIITMTLQPFSFFFGEKTIRLLGLRVHYNVGSSSYSWGLRIFEISQFLW
jgi:hypothetical protein